MRITLRRETSEEVDAKQRGISREFQSGDAAFDRDVYVDTATDDEVLRYVLVSPALRASVLALLDEGVRAVELDDVKGEINASLYSFAHAKHDPARARRIVEAFDRVARGAPPVEHSNEPSSSRHREPAHHGRDGDGRRRVYPGNPAVSLARPESMLDRHGRR